MINKGQLRNLIVIPVIQELGLYNDVAVNLLMGTAAQESHLGTYLKQIGTGPAVGIFQMEPATYKDIWTHFLSGKKELADKVKRFAIMEPDAAEMVGNMYFACAMARVHYFRVRRPLPTDPNDVKALARYWKLFYNTVLGDGTEEEFIANYKKYVA